jgi:hypothetical protein
MNANVPKSAISYPIDLFTWTGRHGATEASDLQGLHKPFMDSLGKEGWNYGFAVEGKSRKITFAGTDIAKDPEDGTVLWWYLKSISEPGFSITVYND